MVSIYQSQHSNFILQWVYTQLRRVQNVFNKESTSNQKLAIFLSNFFSVTLASTQWHIQSLCDNVKPQWVSSKYHQKVIYAAFLKKDKTFN